MSWYVMSCDHTVVRLLCYVISLTVSYSTGVWGGVKWIASTVSPAGGPVGENGDGDEDEDEDFQRVSFPSHAAADGGGIGIGVLETPASTSASLSVCPVSAGEARRGDDELRGGREEWMDGTADSTHITHST